MPISTTIREDTISTTFTRSVSSLIQQVQQVKYYSEILLNPKDYPERTVAQAVGFFRGGNNLSIAKYVLRTKEFNELQQRLQEIQPDPTFATPTTGPELPEIQQQPETTYLGCTHSTLEKFADTMCDLSEQQVTLTPMLFLSYYIATQKLMQKKETKTTEEVLTEDPE